MTEDSKKTPLPALRISGTEVHYYVLCQRKLWWLTHGAEHEHVEGEWVLLWPHLQGQSFYYEGADGARCAQSL